MEPDAHFFNHQAYANVFELASCAFAYPDAAFADAVASGAFAHAWCNALQQTFAANASKYQKSGNRNAACEASGSDDIDGEHVARLPSALPQPVDDNPEETLHRLRRTYTNTFLNMPHPLVSPYESAWTIPGKPLLFANDTCDSVKVAYREQGLEPNMLQEPADHIAYELGFFALALRDGNRLAAARAFWRDHLGRWIERLCEAVVDAQTPFYAQLCDNLQAICATVNEGMNEEAAADVS